MLFVEIFFVLLLIMTNGLLAMSELAVVSARRSRLQHLAGEGNRGARVALQLIDDPNRFLATVQVGITLVGVLAGAYGGATIADRFGDWLDTFPGISPNGDAIAIGIVVAVVTYLSIVIGELVPKRLALANPERVASRIARPMSALSRLAKPVVWLLRISTDAVLRPLGLSQVRETTVTEEEVKSLVAEGTRAGIFLPQEREMIEGVLRLSDRTARVIMTPRVEIVWLDAGADRDVITRVVTEQRYSRVLVCEGSVDRVIGAVQAKDLLANALQGKPLDLRSVMTPVLTVPETTPVLKLLDRFRREMLHTAVVVDEYGATEGMITLTDILEAIAGEFPEVGDELESSVVQREDGSWLIDGALAIDELEDRLQVSGLSDKSGFTTVAGFLLRQIGHLPTVGECLVWRDFVFEVIDMDRRRIDKILIRRGGGGGTE